MACKGTAPPAGAVKPLTAEEAEVNRQRQELQKRLEADRVAEEQARLKRAEDALKSWTTNAENSLTLGDLSIC